MNDSSQMLPAAAVQDAPPTSRESEGVGLVADLMQITKARLTLLVLISTFVGYLMATGKPLDWPRLLHTLIGTALVAGAAAVGNQLIEVSVDRLMARTRNRPLPSGRISRGTAFLLGLAMAVVGLAELAVATTPIAAYLAAVTLLIYLAFYTPMKRRTSFCVTVGAVSGAIPPVVGWTAIDGSLGLGAWVLFGILFAWQMPHFLAIAWMYRDEYSQAGFVMLPQWDRGGTWTAIQSLLYSVALLGISVVPYFTGQAGVVYLIGAVLSAVMMVVCSVYFLVNRTRGSARILFFSSIIYLPVILGLMVVTKP